LLLAAGFILLNALRTTARLLVEVRRLPAASHAQRTRNAERPLSALRLGRPSSANLATRHCVATQVKRRELRANAKARAKGGGGEGGSKKKD